MTCGIEERVLVGDAKMPVGAIEVLASTMMEDGIIGVVNPVEEAVFVATLVCGLPLKLARRLELI